MAAIEARSIASCRSACSPIRNWLAWAATRPKRQNRISRRETADSECAPNRHDCGTARLYEDVDRQRERRNCVLHRVWYRGKRIDGGSSYAMVGRLPYTAMGDAIFAHPTMSEGLVFLLGQVEKRNS